MSKRKQPENGCQANKRLRKEKAVTFVPFQERERTRKYLKKVKEGDEHEFLEDFDKDEYLESIRHTKDDNGYKESLKNDTGCFKHVTTSDGKKTGKLTDHLDRSFCY